jgi:hypothetical protein
MIIHLTKSKLFTVDPAKRFGKEFNVSPDLWTECWLKYKLYGLGKEELRGYVEFRTGRKPSMTSIERWIIRTEIFSLAKKAFKMEARVVQSYFFEEYEKHVIDELTKNMKTSVSKNPKSIV